MLKNDKREVTTGNNRKRFQIGNSEWWIIYEPGLDKHFIYNSCTKDTNWNLPLSVYNDHLKDLVDLKKNFNVELHPNQIVSFPDMNYKKNTNSNELSEFSLMAIHHKSKSLLLLESAINKQANTLNNIVKFKNKQATRIANTNWWVIEHNKIKKPFFYNTDTKSPSLRLPKSVQKVYDGTLKRIRIDCKAENRKSSSSEILEENDEKVLETAGNESTIESQNSPINSILSNEENDINTNNTNNTKNGKNGKSGKSGKNEKNIKTGYRKKPAYQKKKEKSTKKVLSKKSISEAANVPLDDRMKVEYQIGFLNHLSKLAHENNSKEMASSIGDTREPDLAYPRSEKPQKVPEDHRDLRATRHQNDLSFQREVLRQGLLDQDGKKFGNNPRAEVQANIFLENTPEDEGHNSFDKTSRSESLSSCGSEPNRQWRKNIPNAVIPDPSKLSSPEQLQNWMDISLKAHWAAVEGKIQKLGPKRQLKSSSGNAVSSTSLISPTNTSFVEIETGRFASQIRSAEKSQLLSSFDAMGIQPRADSISRPAHSVSSSNPRLEALHDTLSQRLPERFAERYSGMHERFTNPYPIRHFDQREILDSRERTYAKALERNYERRFYQRNAKNLERMQTSSVNPHLRDYEERAAHMALNRGYPERSLGNSRMSSELMQIRVLNLQRKIWQQKYIESQDRLMISEIRNKTHETTRHSETPIKTEPMNSQGTSQAPQQPLQTADKDNRSNTSSQGVEENKTSRASDFSKVDDHDFQPFPVSREELLRKIVAMGEKCGRDALVKTLSTSDLRQSLFLKCFYSNRYSLETIFLILQMNANNQKTTEDTHPTHVVLTTGGTGHKFDETRPVACFLCGQRFLDTQRLEAHLPIHFASMTAGNSRETFKCFFCSTSFISRVLMDLHLRTLHSEKMEFLEEGLINELKKLSIGQSTSGSHFLHNSETVLRKRKNRVNNEELQRDQELLQTSKKPKSSENDTDTASPANEGLLLDSPGLLNVRQDPSAVFMAQKGVPKANVSEKRGEIKVFGENKIATRDTETTNEMISQNTENDNPKTQRFDNLSNFAKNVQNFQNAENVQNVKNVQNVQNTRNESVQREEKKQKFGSATRSSSYTNGCGKGLGIITGTGKIISAERQNESSLTALNRNPRDSHSDNGNRAPRQEVFEAETRGDKKESEALECLDEEDGEKRLCERRVAEKNEAGLKGVNNLD